MSNWDKKQFINHLREQCSREVAKIGVSIIEFSEKYADDISWGRGLDHGTLTYRCNTDVGTIPLFHMTSIGQLNLQINFMRNKEIPPMVIRDVVLKLESNFLRDYDEIEYEGGQDLPTPLPFYVFDVRLGFEENFLRRAGSEINARHMIARIFTLGKLHLKHESLGTSIRLRPQGPITKINNQHWKPGGREGKFLKEAMKHKKNEKIPITFFCGKNDEKNNPVRGSAFPRRGCDKRKGVALVAYDDDIQRAAQVYSHETAHWMGIEHDKVADNRYGTNCEGRGLMSNVSMPGGRPEEWSSCSKDRLKKWLSRPQNDCLKKDEQLLQLEDGFDCNKWRTHLGPFQSGCDRPGQMAHGKWHCTDDGVKCVPVCNFGYKMLHPSGETSIRCFNEAWMNDAQDFTCICDKEFKTPYGSMECSGDTCNLACDSGYDSSVLRTPYNIKLASITCIDNTWSKDPSDIACDYKCREPDVPPEVENDG